MAYSKKQDRDERRFNEMHGPSRNGRVTKATRDERRFNEMHNRGDDSGRLAKLARDERRFNENVANDSAAKARRLYNKADLIGRDLEEKARGLVGKPSGGQNPTASGSGRGGKMDREWENHKWVSRKRNEDGKWIYDYGGSGPGTHNKDYYKDDSQYGVGVHDTAKRLRDARGPLENLNKNTSVGNNNPTAGGSGTINTAKAASTGKNAISDWLAEGLANMPFKNLFK